MKVLLSHAAKNHDIPYHTLIAWVKAGKISSEKIQQGNRKVYQIDGSELTQFLSTKSLRKNSKAATTVELGSQSLQTQIPNLAEAKEPTTVHHHPAVSAPEIKPESPQLSTKDPAMECKAKTKALATEESDTPPWDPDPTDGEAFEGKPHRRKNPVTMAKNSMRSLDLEQLCQVQIWIANRISCKFLTETPAAQHADVTGTL